MNALKRFLKIHNNEELKNLTKGTHYKNYYDRNKYYFNEIYKQKIITDNALVFLITRILKHKSDPNTPIKRIARGFVQDHHELFPNPIEEGSEATDDEGDYEEEKQVEKQEEKPEEKSEEKPEEKPTEKQDENHVENHVEKDVENHVEKQDDKPYKDLYEKINEIHENMEKKLNDLIDGYIDLRNIIKEKKHISNNDVKSRLENMEGKIEMLHGKQMEEATKPFHSKRKPKTKEDALRNYLEKNY